MYCLDDIKYFGEACALQCHFVSKCQNVSHRSCLARAAQVAEAASRNLVCTCCRRSFDSSSPPLVVPDFELFRLHSAGKLQDAALLAAAALKATDAALASRAKTEAIRDDMRSRERSRTERYARVRREAEKELEKLRR